jgi:glycosyltransferase involved in cell wall biosynthesis
LSDPALVLITTSFPMAGDGSEAAGSFVSDMVEELAKRVAVRVVAPGSSSVREQWIPNVEVFRYAAPAKPLSTLKPWRFKDLGDIRRVMHAGACATQDAVRAGPSAHMLALWALPSGEWARRVSRATGVPYSVWTLGSDIWTLGRIPFIRGLLRRVLRQSYTCYSDGLKLADQTRRIAQREVEFLPSTRSVEQHDVRPFAKCPPYRLLFLGRWHQNKGVDLLLDALDLLDSTDWPRIAFVEIQGGGPLEGLVRERVAALRMLGHPVEAGRFLAKAEAEAAMARADWVVIPSRIESIPVVFSDAMKLGRPVIATPVGDLSRLMSAPGCGIVCDGVDAPSIARALRAVVHGNAAADAAALRVVAATFSLPSVAQRLLHDLSGAL